ncbi:hypothetical protein FO519_009043 [Halicephalobus sp. NKZ332]|nr:hypothetical protein FO519_009043 [Halicephalobus sp. NKZ332]
MLAIRQVYRQFRWHIPEAKVRGMTPYESPRSVISFGVNKDVEVFFQYVPTESEIGFFCHVKTPFNIQASIDVSVNSEISYFSTRQNSSNVVYSSEVSHLGWSHFMTKTKLLKSGSGYLRNGRLEVDWFVFLRCVPNEKRFVGVNPILTMLFQAKDTMDFVFFVDEQEVFSHKCILSVVSPVFNAMFKQNFKEAKEGRICIKDFSFEIVQIALRLIYNQPVFEGLTFETAELVYKFFDKYYMTEQMEFIIDWFVSRLSVDSVWKLTVFSFNLNVPYLMDECLALLCNHWDNMATFKDFDGIPMETVKFVVRKLCTRFQILE